MKIWERIILGFISVIIIMIVVDVSALMNNIEIISRVDDLESSKRIELTQSNKVAYVTQRIKSNLRELFLEIESDKRPHEIAYAEEEVKTYISDLQSSLKILHDATNTGYLLSEDEDELAGEMEELAIIDSLYVLTFDFVAGVNEILDLLDNNETDAAEDYFEYDVEPVSRILQDLISVLVVDVEEEVAWAINQLNLKVRKTIRLGIYLTILSILLSLAIGSYISKSISKPLYKLISGTREIGLGNLEVEVNLDTKGELQLLADSFNDMVRELKARIEAIDKLNEELEESNQTKDKYFSIIAHDLKNPFNVILGFTDLLVENYKDFDEEKRQRIIRELNKSSKVIYDLLENLLTWSRSQSGKIELYPEILSVNSIIDNSVNSYSGVAKQKQITILNNISEETNIYADEFTITVAINNILNNAVKFTPDKGLIVISTIKNKNQIELRIKDTGIGMKSEIIENLFRSKKITSTPGTRREQGTGLGLILIKDFTERNKGNLSIISEPEKGTEFRLLFPAAKSI
ncbi:HAMP domain-containing protein [Maribellus comscasis]|uniref:histidine kinase n=1 Tax=Maribellus comscasis TaxID=2681766 RepID=A0A6I6JY12_9BACT|nr:HAMP domain-containing sensor histidine kinase [Maribellus comscasis]QGY47925.1 HAMP domain-containing protein [Maribellus comscasis]